MGSTSGWRHPQDLALWLLTSFFFGSFCVPPSNMKMGCRNYDLVPPDAPAILKLIHKRVSWMTPWHKRNAIEMSKCVNARQHAVIARPPRCNGHWIIGIYQTTPMDGSIWILVIFSHINCIFSVFVANPFTRFCMFGGFGHSMSL